MGRGIATGVHGSKSVWPKVACVCVSAHRTPCYSCNHTHTHTHPPAGHHGPRQHPWSTPRLHNNMTWITQSPHPEIFRFQLNVFYSLSPSKTCHWMSCELWMIVSSSKLVTHLLPFPSEHSTDGDSNKLTFLVGDKKNRAVHHKISSSKQNNVKVNGWIGR